MPTHRSAERCGLTLNPLFYFGAHLLEIARYCYDNALKYALSTTCATTGRNAATRLCDSRLATPARRRFYPLYQRFCANYPVVLDLVVPARSCLQKSAGCLTQYWDKRTVTTHRTGTRGAKLPSTNPACWFGPEQLKGPHVHINYARQRTSLQRSPAAEAHLYRLPLGHELTHRFWSFLLPVQG